MAFKIPKNFLNLSRLIGDDSNLVQGAGGNTSYKENGEMWVKASGKWLSEAGKRDIFVLVNSEKIRDNVIKNSVNPSDGVIIENSVLRPSIETALHALMPHKVVIHTHPVELLSWLVRDDGYENLTKLLKDLNWGWVSYIRPGVELARAVQKVIQEGQVDILLLGSHGIVVGGEGCASAFDLMNKVLARCSKPPRKRLVQDNFIIERLADDLKMRLPKYKKIHSLALDKIAYDYCNNENGVLYPDQAVFLGSKIPCYDGEIDGETIAEYLENNPHLLFIVVKGKGVLIANDAKMDVDEMLLCHTEVLLRIDSGKKLQYLTEKDVDSLLDWEPEKYRQSIEN